jgi:mannose-1-phosphate guanylyltransferase
MGDTTLIGWLIHQMPKSIDRVILASNYKIDMIKKYIEESDFDVEVLVVDEPEPLGTGGAMKNSERYIDDTFVAFNGDLITSIDVEEFIRFHKSKGGIGSIALWEVEDPTAFGCIGIDGQQKIYKFKEKPKPEEVFSNLINAGTYVLEPEIFDHMEADKKVSIEREVFPFVIDKGLYGFHFTGFWIDSGTQPLYLQAHKILLENQGTEVYLGKDVSMGEGARVGQYSVVYEGVNIGKGASITGSVIFKGSRIGSGSVVDGAVIGERCTVGDNCVIPSGCILGDGRSLTDNTKLERDARIPQEEEE